MAWILLTAWTTCPLPSGCEGGEFSWAKFVPFLFLTPFHLEGTSSFVFMCACVRFAVPHFGVGLKARQTAATHFAGGPPFGTYAYPAYSGCQGWQAAVGFRWCIQYSFIHVPGMDFDHPQDVAFSRQATH